MRNGKVVKIINTKLEDFNSIDEYLLHTYGAKKLEESKCHREFTHLDVIGYTLDGSGFEKDEGKYYEEDEIKRIMHCKWDEDEDEEDAEWND